MKAIISTFTTIIALAISAKTSAETQMLMPVTPALSPDGSTLVFSWENDLWKISTNPQNTSPAERLTIHPSKELSPIFSPDGKTIYFNTNREGSIQIFSIPLDKSSPPKQITFHSEPNILEDVSPDGKSVIYRSARDTPGRNPYRIYQSPVTADKPERMLFNAYAINAKISPDNTKILITREGAEAYRTGYHGSKSSQIWLYDTATNTYTQPVANPYGCLSPLWKPDGSGFYYVSGAGGFFNLWEHTFENSENKQLTTLTDGNLMFPVISKDGSTIIYRYLFHYYTFNTTTHDSEKITLKHNLPISKKSKENITLKTTEDADFSPSGLEIAFTAKGNIFAMDTVLREPIQLTNTPAHEKNIYFSADAKAIYYIHDDGIKTSINKITKQNPKQFWWETNKIKSNIIIKSEATIKSFIPSPDGKHICYNTHKGELFIHELETQQTKKIAKSWRPPSFNWSPNSQWITYSLQNNNFNSDIYIAPIDGSQQPVNVTKHPDNETTSSFSPDGKKLAFLGKRHNDYYDLYYVSLTPQGSEKSTRELKIETAKKTMKNDPAYAKSTAKAEPKNTTKNTPNKESTKENANKKSPTKDTPVYYLKDIQKRIKYIPLNRVRASNVFWRPDSKAILINSSNTTYSYDLKTRRPTKYADASGSLIRHSKKGNIYWLSNNIPAVLKNKKSIKYTFEAQTTFDHKKHQQYKFRLIWRTIRDGFYDEQMNGTDWDQIRIKYETAATSAKTVRTFERIIDMMLGELNASHTGYTGQDFTAWKKPTPWKEEMLHLGVKFTTNENGWLITKSIPNSPATSKLSRLKKGETITHINQIKVNHETLLKDVLWGQIKKNIQLKVLNQEAKERTVNLSPISFKHARSLMRADKINENQQMVETLSNGKLGYIHVARMKWNEFRKFEQHIYENGAGKDGLIIDVRNNGGGFTADHLLTALTKPHHAYTIPRNGGIGYPQDRFIYASWDKPILVLCNQNSFSNAEIFTHAIKTLNRGKVVGVATGGGVISTGSVDILKQGRLRMPFRGWFLSTTGQDMELNGATPDYTVWPLPGELENGIDKQIEKAVEVLTNEVTTKQQQPIKPKYSNRK